MAWRDHGTLPWKRLVEPAVRLARDGFPVSFGLARSLEGILDEMKRYPASLAQFSKGGTPYAPGDVLKQPDLSRTLDRIASRGPAGFYEGETAGLIEQEMRKNGGIITREDLKAYTALKRPPLRGTYRGYEILGMPPASSGGVAVVQALNILEGFDLKASGFGSAKTIHTIAESMRRAFADRAQHLGDPAFNADMPVERLTSKDYAATLRRTISPTRASVSSPTSFTWPTSGDDTTHLSVVDEARNAVALTYTLEYRLRVAHCRSGRWVPAEQRDGRLQRRSRIDERGGSDRNPAQPRGAGKTDAVEHVAHHRRQRWQAVHGDGQPRRTDDHQHGAADHRARRGLRHERSGSGRCRPVPSPVAARSHHVRAVDDVAGYAGLSGSHGASTAGDPCRRARPRSSATMPRRTWSRAASTGVSPTVARPRSRCAAGGLSYS